MKRRIPLKPFSELVEIFKHFHSDKVFHQPSTHNDEESFNSQLSLVTNELSSENIRAFFRLSNLMPVLVGIDRKGHYNYMSDLNAQVISHLCTVEAADCFLPHDTIMVDTVHCLVGDVIFWSGEWMVVTEIDVDKQTATTVQIKSKKDFFIDLSFKFGLYDTPHYVIGKTVN
jgi:hypothetical protein